MSRSFSFWDGFVVGSLAGVLFLLFAAMAIVPAVNAQTPDGVKAAQAAPAYDRCEAERTHDPEMLCKGDAATFNGFLLSRFDVDELRGYRLTGGCGFWHMASTVVANATLCSAACYGICR